MTVKSIWADNSSDKWDAQALRPGSYEFVSAFKLDYSPDRDIWAQVVERFCKWLGMSGAILERKGADLTGIRTQFQAPASSTEEDLKWERPGKPAVDDAIPPDFTQLGWEALTSLLETKPYEVLEDEVSEDLRKLGVRNYFILALEPVRPISRLLLLYNREEGKYFDNGTYLTCLTTLRHHAAVANLLTRDENASEVILAQHPHVQVHRLWASLDCWRFFAGEYPPGLIGEFFDLALDEWPQDGLKDLITETLVYFFGENWKRDVCVIAKTKKWEESTCASVARACTVIGMPEIAEALCVSASKET